MKEILLSTIIVCSGFLNLTAQTLRGKITDTKNRAIEDAYIVNLSNAKHIHSGTSGSFEFKDVKSMDSLRISHTGYSTQYIYVSNINEFLNIRLEERTVSIKEVKVMPNIDAINVIADVDIKTNPVGSSQEILQKVPGLIIGQHAGGGKAEQIFLRGYDIDHGTDVSINYDGMPVNMVSHAHGQGYSDLHFIIPEVIDNINFGKGPYYGEQGNFNTAGYIDFKSKDRLASNLLKVEGGQFNSRRILGMFNVLNSEKQSAYIATEYLLTDGPFESPQNFNRFNFMAKYSDLINNSDRLSISASHFTSQWDASGQIPNRAVESGIIGRFGAIDDTEGGNTDRSSLQLSYIKTINSTSFIKNTAYYSNYNFELFSNFTYFLEDSIHGDQIKQKENRQLFGIKSEYNKYFSFSQFNGSYKAGIGFRNDFSNDNYLANTINRRTIQKYIQKGDITETNLFGYLSSSLNFGKLTINPSIRIDQIQFGYYNHLDSVYNNSKLSDYEISPKINFLYNYSDNLQLYLKSGKGFHSNDSRLVIAGEVNNNLAATYGSDIGFIWKPISRIVLNAAAWYLYSEQEFVYVGDAGIVEASGESERKGLDFSLRYQALNWLFVDIDANYTLARALNEDKGSDFIPLAPDFTTTAGINVIHPNGIYGGIRMRHIDDRPANEDNSIIAKGYTVLDMNAGYQWNKIDLGFSIQNLLNTEWNETQFATESRLKNESTSVEEIHFTPGTPFFFKLKAAYSF